MSVALYMDVHAPRAITRALRVKGIDVLTAQEDGADFEKTGKTNRVTNRVGSCSGVP